MGRDEESQGLGQNHTIGAAVRRRDRIIPNPKLKLLDQVREVMRLKHWTENISTQRVSGGWQYGFIEGPQDS